MTVKYLKLYGGYSPQEHSGMSFLLSMEVEKQPGNGSLHGKNKECGRISGKSSLLCLISRRNSRGR